MTKKKTAVAKSAAPSASPEAVASAWGSILGSQPARATRIAEIEPCVKTPVSVAPAKKAPAKRVRKPAAKAKTAVTKSKPVITPAPAKRVRKPAVKAKVVATVKPDVYVSAVAAAELLGMIGEARLIISRLAPAVAKKLAVRGYLTQEMEGGEAILREAILREAMAI